MPKQFGHCTRCTLVVASLLALNFAGCRTATSRLASIPGMGWMDRGEKSFGQGWADYEPAPELPPPSATSEPSSTTSTSGLASNSGGSNSGRPSSSSSANAESKRYNTGSTYGNYALGGSGSSSGASGASLGTRGPIGSSASTPQQGFYGTESAPNYATSTPSSYASYGNSGSSAVNANPGVSRYGDYAVSGSAARLQSSASAQPSSSLGSPTYGGSPNAAAYTADRDSRFGSPGFDGTTSRTGAWSSDTESLNTSSQNATGTYTPPGFPSSSYSTPNPAINTGSASRFDTYQGAAQSAPDQGSQPLGVAQGSTGLAAAAAPSSASGNNVSSYAGSLGPTVPAGINQTQPAIGGAQPTVGGYGDTTRPPINNAPSGANTRIDNVGPLSGNDRFGGTTQGTSPGAQPGLPSASSTTINSPTSNGSAYADVLMQAAPNQVNGTAGGGTPAAAAAAHGYMQAAQDGFGQPREAVKDYASASQDAGHHVMEQQGTSVPQYPSTNTPNGYLSPSTSAPTTTPNTPPSSSIRRSSTPWRPGSTSDFQGSNATGQGSTTIQTSYRPSLGTSIAAHDGLSLAVGDKFQFPRMLR